jgi:hypothetical protein
VVFLGEPQFRLVASDDHSACTYYSIMLYIFGLSLFVRNRTDINIRIHSLVSYSLCTYSGRVFYMYPL